MPANINSRIVTMYAICLISKSDEWSITEISDVALDNENARSIELTPYVCRISDGTPLEFDPASITTDYCYHALRGVFLAPDGSYIREAIPVVPPAPILPLTPLQLRTWLLINRGLTGEDIAAVIDASALIAQQKALASIAFEYALTFERSNQFIEAIGAVLSMSSDEIDSAFREAHKI
jgi:hypothetical protein